MQLPITFYLGLRYWWSKKSEGFTPFIMFFSVTGIFLGVASLILVSSIMNGLENEQKSKLLGPIPHVVLKSEVPLQQEKYLALQEQLLKVPEIQSATLYYGQQVLLQSASAIQGVMLQGVDPIRNPDVLASGQLIFGQLEDIVKHRYGLILGASLAESLQVGVGDWIRVFSSEGGSYSPMGLLPSQRKFQVAGLFSTGAMGDSGVAFTYYLDALKLAHQPSAEVHQIRIDLHDAFDVIDVEATLQKMLPSGFEIHTWKAQYGHQLEAVKMEKRMTILMLCLIILVAIFNIVSALVMMVNDKTTDIAILKTQGLRKKDIMTLFLTQGMLSGLVGLILGLIVGCSLTFYFEEILKNLGIFHLPPGQHIPIIFDGEQLILIAGGTLVTTFLTTLYPALRAASVLPAEALRYE